MPMQNTWTKKLLLNIQIQSEIVEWDVDEKNAAVNSEEIWLQSTIFGVPGSSIFSCLDFNSRCYLRVILSPYNSVDRDLEEINPVHSLKNWFL